MIIVKYLFLTTLFLFLQTFTLLADVKFEFIYADEPGTGMHKKPKAKKALEKMGRQIGSKWLKRHKAHIKIKVTSDKLQSSWLARAHDTKYLEEKQLTNFYSSFLNDKIVHGKDNTSKYDGHIEINFKNNFSFDSRIRNSNQLDFQKVVLHEITHLLGIYSNSEYYIESHKKVMLNDIIKGLIKDIFIYGLTEISGASQKIDLVRLKNDINRAESLNIDLSSYILNQDSLPEEIKILKNYLLLELKDLIKKDSKIKNSELVDRLYTYLEFNNISVQDFIYFDCDIKTLILDTMLLGISILSSEDAKSFKDLSDVWEVNLFKTFYKLNKDDYQKKLLQVMNDQFLVKRKFSFLDPGYRLTALKLIVKFTEKCILNDGVSSHEIIKFKNEINLIINPLLISISEFPFEFFDELIESHSELTDDYRIPTCFDQFVYFKKGEKLFNLKTTGVERLSVLQKNKNQKLCFKGPQTLKYLGAPIPLNGQDAHHVAVKSISIMGPRTLNGVSYIKEWDKYSTAMLLDLGYDIDNYWTRLWKRKKQDKKFERKLKRNERLIRKIIRSS